MYSDLCARPRAGTPVRVEYCTYSPHSCVTVHIQMAVIILAAKRIARAIRPVTAPRTRTRYMLMFLQVRLARRPPGPPPHRAYAWRPGPEHAYHGPPDYPWGPAIVSRT